MKNNKIQLTFRIIAGLWFVFCTYANLYSIFAFSAFEIINWRALGTILIAVGLFMNRRYLSAIGCAQYALSQILEIIRLFRFGYLDILTAILNDLEIVFFILLMVAALAPKKAIFFGVVAGISRMCNIIICRYYFGAFFGNFAHFINSFRLIPEAMSEKLLIEIGVAVLFAFSFAKVKTKIGELLQSVPTAPRTDIISDDVPNNYSQSQRNNADSMEENLRALQEMYNLELITKDEYIEKKKQILGL